MGSNLGDRKKFLSLAREAIGKEVGSIETSSAVHESSAWGLTKQPDFLNQVILVKTSLTPFKVLSKIQEIELDLGRERFEKWGPRIIDIDILYFGNLIINSENLIIPHPGIPERRFTLEPLKEVAPDFVHPVLQKTNSELLDLCKDSLGVQAFLET